MNKNGPIIIIEDDVDDQEILEIVFQRLNYPNELVIFTEARDAFDYLSSTDKVPFIILSDINMPKLNGFELRDRIRSDGELLVKCIPYLFYTTESSRESVIDAYAMSVQGFFKKPRSIDDIEDTMRAIVEYWKRCLSPANF